MARIEIGVVLLVAAAPACDSQPGPELISVTPVSATQGSQAVISGLRLCGAGMDVTCADSGGALDLGLDDPVRAIITAYSADQIEFAVPTIAPLGPTQLVLTVNDTSSNALPFEVTAP